MKNDHMTSTTYYVSKQLLKLFHISTEIFTMKLINYTVLLSTEQNVELPSSYARSFCATNDANVTICLQQISISSLATSQVRNRFCNMQYKIVFTV